MITLTPNSTVSHYWLIRWNEEVRFYIQKVKGQVHYYIMLLKNGFLVVIQHQNSGTEPFMLTFTPTANIGSQINLTCLSLDCGRMPGYLDSTGRTCKASHRQGPASHWSLTQELFAEALGLTTALLFSLNYSHLLMSIVFSRVYCLVVSTVLIVLNLHNLHFMATTSVVAVQLL